MTGTTLAREAASIALLLLEAVGGVTGGNTLRAYRLNDDAALHTRETLISVLQQLPKPVECSAERRQDILVVRCILSSQVSTSDSIREKSTELGANSGVFGELSTISAKSPEALVELRGDARAVIVSVQSVLEYRRQYSVVGGLSFAAYGPNKDARTRGVVRVIRVRDVRGVQSRGITHVRPQ